MVTNQILLGDCYKLIKQIPDKTIDCIYTDIPYLHETGGSGSSRISKNVIAKTKELDPISHGIDYKIFDEFVRVCKKINVFIWCSKLQIIDILKYFVVDKNCNFEILVWVKPNPIPQTNNTWLPDIEYCLYFREKGVVLNHGFHLKSKWHSGLCNIADKNHFDHPTIKPLELVKRHIAHTTPENAIVLDPFVGSGTTAIASREIGRQYIGIEIDPRWHKIAVDRLNNITARGQISFMAR